MTLGDFTQQADSYARSRPGYPEELVDQLLADAAVRRGDAVADVGAGTGIFARMLVERGLAVTAVEPNSEMRRRAVDAGRMAWVDGTFENTTLRSQSQQWVTAAQAFHWADVPRALPEVRRILNKEGTFTVLWNNRDNQSSEVLLAVNDIISRHVPEFHHGYRDERWAEVLVSTGDFTNVCYREARHVVPMDKERFLSLWQSNNQLTTTAGAERFLTLFDELSRWVEAADLDIVEVPYLCRAWTASVVP